MCRNRMIVEIKGEPWEILILSKKEYRHKNGDDSDAITHRELKVVEFHRGAFYQKIVTHELLHAFMTECCIHDADLTGDQTEEVCASLLENSISEIQSLTKQILKELP